MENAVICSARGASSLAEQESVVRYILRYASTREMKVSHETKRLADDERGDRALFVVCVKGWDCCGSGFRADGTRWYPMVPDGASVLLRSVLYFFVCFVVRLVFPYSTLNFSPPRVNESLAKGRV